MIEISTKALELNAGMDFLYVYLTKAPSRTQKDAIRIWSIMFARHP